MGNTSKEWVLTTDGEANFHGVCCDGDWLLRVQHNGELMPFQQEHNMELVVQAGTIANETGLSPKEIIEQRDYLSESLKISQIHANNLGNLLARTEDENMALKESINAKNKRIEELEKVK